MSLRRDLPKIGLLPNFVQGNKCHLRLYKKRDFGSVEEVQPECLPEFLHYSHGRVDGTTASGIIRSKHNKDIIPNVK